MQITSINKVELQGRLGQDARIYTMGDTKVARFNISTQEAFTNPDGSHRVETTWHSITAWESPGFPDFSLLKRGTTVNVVGRIKVSKYITSEGIERLYTEYIARELRILE